MFSELQMHAITCPVAPTSEAWLLKLLFLTSYKRPEALNKQVYPTDNLFLGIK